MTFTDNFSVTRLFIEKSVKIFADSNFLFTIKAKPVKEILTDDH